MSFFQDMPAWLIKLLAIGLGVFVVAAGGLLAARLFRRLTDKNPLNQDHD